MRDPKTIQPGEGSPAAKNRPRIEAPRGAKLTCQGWRQEAALRMLMNSEASAEAPQPLWLQQARPLKDPDSLTAISHLIQRLKDDETLLVESGGAAGVYKTHAEAPRVVLAGVAPERSPETRSLSEATRAGNALFGRDAAGSWTRVSGQQTLQTLYESFGAVARAHFGGELKGRLIVSGGMGSTGGAQPLAAALHGAAFLGIDVESERITGRIRTGYCDFCVNSLDEALRILKNAVRERQPVSVGLVGNCADILPALASRGVVPDILTDLTGVDEYAAHGLSLEDAEALSRNNPDDYRQRLCDSIERHLRAIADLQKLGAVVFDFGNHLQDFARRRCAIRSELRLPDFVSTYLRPVFAQGRAPLRWTALSGERGDIRRADELLLELCADDGRTAGWIRQARKSVKFNGLPARTAWLLPEQRRKFAERLNGLAAAGELKAPVVVARDQMICRTELLPLLGSRGGQAIQTAIGGALNELASGTAWMWLESEGAKTPDTCRATQTVVADGTPGAQAALQRLMEGEDTFSLLGGDETGEAQATSPQRSAAERQRG